MKASALEFRFRMLIHFAIFLIAFVAPWNWVLRTGAAGPNAHAWGVLSAELGKAGVMGIGQAFDVLLSLGILFAFLAAGLRTWGVAYLGAGVVQDGRMVAGVVSDGPYRHVRNPLYLGVFLHTLALALLMPVSGAVFAVVAVAVFEVRLILGEEAFLTRRLGAEYLAYARLVPRLWPSLRSRTAAGGRQARWGQAFLAEIYMWGVAGSFAFAGWRYNASLLIQCVLVSLGVALVVRASRPQRQA